MHDKEFEKRYTDMLLNIRLIKILSMSMKVYKFYFLIPSRHTPHAVLFFKEYLNTAKPMVYNHKVKKGLTNFRELSNDFSSSDITNYDSYSTRNTLLISGQFIRERCYKRFMESFKD